MKTWRADVDRPTWERAQIQVEADSIEEAMQRVKKKREKLKTSTDRKLAT